MKPLNFDNLDKMIAEKYISVQKHPTLDLYIYNYTHRAQFDRMWNNETMQCRGLIMDGNRNIVSRPFPKFFNYGEINQDYLPSTKHGQFTAGPVRDALHDLQCKCLIEGNFTVTEKMDGSLGISYFDPDGKMYIATRGSFVSEQAQRANKILNEKYDPMGWGKRNTYLFEIIYPENRIVVNYGDREELILLAILDTKSGEEKPYDLLRRYEQFIPVVPQYDGITDFEKLEQRPNSEGYVVHYPSTGLRFKIKFDEYVRLHRIVTGINAKRIWELLSSGQSLDEIIDRVPDEFYAWVKKTEQELRQAYLAYDVIAEVLFDEVKNLPTRKEQALHIKDNPLRGIVFNMLDSKPYDQIIWKMIEPKWERPFKEDET